MTLVDRTNHHLFQPLLYQVAAGILPPGLIAPALRGVVKNAGQRPRPARRGARHRPRGRRSSTRTGPDGRALELPYDTLIVAAGATHSYFGKDQFAEFAPGMKTIEDARYTARRDPVEVRDGRGGHRPAERAEWLTFVVIGAGPTGVELVGQIAELAHTVLPRDYRSVNTREARIILLEGAPSVLPPFAHRSCRRYTQRAAREDGRGGAASTRLARRHGPRVDHGQGPGGRARPSAPGRGSGPRACRRRRWPSCSPRRRASRPTGRDGSRCNPTAPCRDTPRCSRSATWCR